MAHLLNERVEVCFNNISEDVYIFRITIVSTKSNVSFIGY